MSFVFFSRIISFSFAKTLLRICCILYLLISCNSGSTKFQEIHENYSEHDSITLKYDTSAIAIISLDSSKHIVGNRAIASSAFTQTELYSVDSLIKVYMANYNASLTGDRYLYQLKHNYKMQIVVYVNPEREKEVWVNAFCDARADYWESYPVVVFDGGACYFNLTINLTKKSIVDSFVNG